MFTKIIIRKLVVCFVFLTLAGGQLFGVPINHEELEKLLVQMKRPKIAALIGKRRRKGRPK